MEKGKHSPTWREKLEKDMLPKLVNVPPKWATLIGKGKMLIPTPLQIDAAVRKIPKGKLATVNAIRHYLADEARADMTCPLTTGIFLNISAHAAEEDKLNGKKRITPYWRVLKETGQLNPKFPGGIVQQAAYLKKEGFEVLGSKSGKHFFVKNYAEKCFFEYQRK